MSQTRKRTAFSIGIIVLVSLSMRAPMSSVGPLAGQLQAALGLSASAAGFVTTIPLIAFSAMAPVAGRIAVAVDSKRLLGGCLGLIAIGILIRSFGGVVGLYFGTACLGVAIGTMNVLMPALIRKQFPDRIGLMMGSYLTSMTAAAALFAGICQDIAAGLDSWRLGLASPVVFAAVSIAACAMSGTILSGRLDSAGQAGGTRCITGKRAAVALFMGTQSLFYFSMVAWLPTIAESYSGVGQDSGMLLLIMQASGLAPSLLMPMISQKTRRRDGLAFIGAVLFVFSFLALLGSKGNDVLLLVGTILAGTACSATLSLSLTIIAEQGSNPAQTAKISAFSQCIGYAFAAVGPMGMGYVYDLFGSWEIVLYCMMALAVIMTLLGLYAGKPDRK